MRKITAIAISLLVAAIVFIAGQSYLKNKAWTDGVKSLSEWEIIEPNDYNGGIGDIVIGDKNAKVKVIEYADFQCSACAITFPYIHDVVKEYGDQIAYVYRNYAISYHQNATAAATAAFAVNNQGYFEDYAKLLFEKQEDWFYAEGVERDNLFEGYFKEVAGDSADLDRYKADLKSSEIKNKLALDREFANRVKLNATPLIYINKEKFDVESSKESEFKQSLRDRIDAALKD
ncbi:thioredoxin domain-containing protein [Candidatus Saccharibacteria bacterium]|nr:thioredoxin domain-containing protein [Candidatus Saccharibacteria bacterium]